MSCAKSINVKENINKKKLLLVIFKVLQENINESLKVYASFVDQELKTCEATIVIISKQIN